MRTSIGSNPLLIKPHTALVIRTFLKNRIERIFMIEFLKLALVWPQDPTPKSWPSQKKRLSRTLQLSGVRVARLFGVSMGLENLMLYRYSKKDIKEAVKAAMKKEFLDKMQSSVKVKDRLWWNSRALTTLWGDQIWKGEGWIYLTEEGCWTSAQY